LTALDFDQTVKRYHEALDEFMKGNADPAKSMFSHRNDVTLANPFGPAVLGWKRVADTAELAATHYRDGEVTGIENISKYVTHDLAYIVEVERYKAKVGGREEVTPLALRVTSIFRPEDGTWKLVHRHADPITAVQPVESVISNRASMPSGLADDD
jgi:ketosteroid isomerase-like protein